ARSVAYQHMWTPPAHVAWIHIAARRGGKPVTHLAKHYRGMVTHHLTTAKDTPTTPAALRELLTATLGLQVELDYERAGRFTLTIEAPANS
ncbi:MAG: hypothetical protein Q4Q03_02415, partial [Bowdeniella nasicola]|nr:hypothetical protein [Bowdeniella nasicola]